MSDVFAVECVWDAIQNLLEEQLDGVDVAAAGAKDFDDDDNLILVPPAVRGVFIRESASCDENQHITYDVTQEYAIMSLDADLSADTQAQRRASAALAGRVKNVLIGARLRLADGETSEPLIYVGMEPMPVRDAGVAYVTVFQVPGIAQFPAPNAEPDGE
jgi:hypothetical protein